MKDSRSSLLLLVSLLLVVVSFVLIWTWGYDYYTKKSNTGSFPATDSASVITRLKDSIQNEYDMSLQHLYIQLDSALTHSDSLKAALDIKLAEFYRLRAEIISIIKNRGTGNNYAAVKQKIAVLQNKADDLDDKNRDLDKENKKLNDVLNKISNAGTSAEKNDLVIKNNNTERSPVYSAYTVSEMKLTAITNNGEKETETTIAEKAGKLTGVFNVVNFNSQLTNAELMVVVTDPAGRVLKNSGWDSGIFNTPDGKKVYSYKFNFNYSRGETRQLLFSIQAGIFTKGNYVMEVYYNGLIIGRTVKTLI